MKTEEERAYKFLEQTIGEIHMQASSLKEEQMNDCKSVEEMIRIFDNLEVWKEPNSRWLFNQNRDKASTKRPMLYQAEWHRMQHVLAHQLKLLSFMIKTREEECE